MTVLARFDGHDTEGGSVWYEKGMEWAKTNGVSDGSNPDGNITREQFAAMLYRYAGSPAVSGSIDHFTDARKVSSYATDAVRWAVSTGIIGGTLAPQSNATRAQVATMLMRFCTNLTKQLFPRREDRGPRPPVFSRRSVSVTEGWEKMNVRSKERGMSWPP